MKKPKVTRAVLLRKIEEMEAQLASTYHFADAELSRVEFPKLLASGVILRLTILGQDRTIIPVCIRGGLSPETIDALRADLKRSYEESIEFKPSGARR